jgi:hypothetical protein
VGFAREPKVCEERLQKYEYEKWKCLDPTTSNVNYRQQGFLGRGGSLKAFFDCEYGLDILSLNESVYKHRYKAT